MLSEQASLRVTNVTGLAAWEALAADRQAQLVDVRSQAELDFVGGVDLSSIGKLPIHVEWQSYPGLRLNENFVDRCSAALSAAGASNGSAIYFICRSGARSHSAAAAMSSAGYTRCYNIAEGFEGPLDARRRRGSKGWKSDGLPWLQS